METPPVPLLLGVTVLSLCGLAASKVSLNVSPNRLQFFSGDSVSLSCVEGGQTVEGTVRRTTGGTTDVCGPGASGFGLLQDSSCLLDLLSSYTGLYWCETSSGRSEWVQINVFPREEFSFILEIPAHPVVAGSDVTLRCRHKDGSSRAAYFFKNNEATGDKAQQFTIGAVQPTDEGLYYCSTDASRPSPQSWLRVRDPTGTSAPPSTSFLSAAVISDFSSVPSSSPTPPTLPPSPPPPPSCVSPVRLVLHLFTFSFYCFCTGLLVSICCSRRMENKLVVSMEISHVRGTREEEEDDYILFHEPEERLDSN